MTADEIRNAIRERRTLLYAVSYGQGQAYLTLDMHISFSQSYADIEDDAEFLEAIESRMFEDFAQRSQLFIVGVRS